MLVLKKIYRSYDIFLKLFATEVKNEQTTDVFNAKDYRKAGVTATWFCFLADSRSAYLKSEADVKNDLHCVTKTCLQSSFTVMRRTKSGICWWPESPVHVSLRRS